LRNIKATAHVRRGESGPAIEEFTLAVAADPRNVSGMVNLASLYAQTGSRAEAIKELHKVLAIEPDNEHALSLLDQLE
jgi:Flp pilus assembly protein TadD